MSLEYERKSPEELKARTRQQMSAASRTTNTVNLTEENWRGLIGVLQTQNEVLEQVQVLLSTLATREEMASALSRQAECLEMFMEQSRAVTEKFRMTMETSAANMNAQLNQTLDRMSRQAGSLNEKFSSAFSMEEAQRKAWEKKLFWISLIPSAALLLLELARLLLPLG